MTGSIGCRERRGSGWRRWKCCVRSRRDMIQLPPDFKEFLRLLIARGVEYLIVGGYAVNQYGHTRFTGDLDVWVAVHERNAEQLTAVLREFGFPGAGPELLELGKMIRMGVPPLRIEVLTVISGVDFTDCYGRRMVETVDGLPLTFISLDDLKRNKRASGRTQDLADVERLGG